MFTAKIDTVCSHVVANTEEQAMSSANYINDNFCESKFSYVLVEKLAPNEWLAILAHSESEAKQAQENFHNPQDV